MTWYAATLDDVMWDAFHRAYVAAHRAAGHPSNAVVLLSYDPVTRVREVYLTRQAFGLVRSIAEAYGAKRCARPLADDLFPAVGTAMWPAPRPRQGEGSATPATGSDGEVAPGRSSDGDRPQAVTIRGGHKAKPPKQPRARKKTEITGRYLGEGAGDRVYQVVEHTQFCETAAPDSGDPQWKAVATYFTLLNGTHLTPTAEEGVLEVNGSKARLRVKR